ncbi:MAG: hypothetical protein AAF655_16985 [Bacteroidota bacterium]
MSDLLEILREGTLLQKGNASQVIDHILQKPQEFGQLIRGMNHEDFGICMRSLYCAEQICRKRPESVQPYTSEIVASLPNWKERREMAQLLPLLISHLELQGEELGLALAFIRERLENSKKTFEKVNCLQAMADHATRNHWLVEEVLATFDEYEHKGGTAINARIRKLRKKLAKLD